MVVVYAAPGAISDASRNNDRNHTLPGNRSLERSFRYQAPDPSVFSDFLYVGSGGVSASYSPVTSSTQTNQNESHDKEDTMGARESKVSSPPNFRYLPTNPDIFKLPEDEPDSQAPDQGPEYVFMFGSLTSLLKRVETNVLHRFGQWYYKNNITEDVVVTRRHKLAETESIKECIVCAETKGLQYFPDRSISKACEHPPHTCLDCVKKSIKVNFENRKWNEIHCPECQAVMQFEDVERHADKATLEK